MQAIHHGEISNEPPKSTRTRSICTATDAIPPQNQGCKNATIAISSLVPTMNGRLLPAPGQGNDVVNYFLSERERAMIT